MSTPLISVVIPTRDRPQFVALALARLRKQTFDDFEVIVSDNALRHPFAPDPALFDGVRFRYVKPPRPLWITQHWEFAVSQARGQYVGVIGDKSVLVADALERVAAEIKSDAPDAVSWAAAGFTSSLADLEGRGVLIFNGRAATNPVRISPAEVLEYLLSTYLDPAFEGDHQLEIRGSIYHGVFASSLLARMKSRFGKVFRFYAPDLNAQCAAMQIARCVTYIPRPLEVHLAGPSNGIAVAMATPILKTQEEAASGESSPQLIPGVSASISHLLACDLVAVSGRPLKSEQWTELHRRAAFDLYRAGDWPDVSMQRRQVRALLASAQRLGPDVTRRVRREKRRAARTKVRGFASQQLRKYFESYVDDLRRIVGLDGAKDRRWFDSLDAALQSIAECTPSR